MASWASASDGRGEARRNAKNRSNPAPFSAVVSQCQAVSNSARASRKALCWLSKHLQRKPGVQLGIVPAAPYQRSVLVMLDQMVIRIAGEGQRIEPQGIHRKQIQQPQAGIGRPQMGQVESDQVVPQQEVRAIGQVV